MSEKNSETAWDFASIFGDAGLAGGVVELLVCINMFKVMKLNQIGLDRWCCVYRFVLFRFVVVLVEIHLFAD